MVDKSLREIIQRNVVPQVQSVRTPHKYFILNSLTLRNPPRALVRFGTRNVYTDFPRVAWVIYNELHRYCNFIASQWFSEKDKLQLNNLESTDDKENSRRKSNWIVQYLKNEKKRDHPLNTIYQYTAYLEKLGIIWSIHFRSWDKRPFIKFNANRYYKQIWPKKILTFISCLESGNDNPITIYKMASDLSVEYSFRRNRVKKPMIFRMVEKNGISLSLEIEKLMKLVKKLYGAFSNSEITTAYDIMLQYEIEATLNDMYETLNEIELLKDRGHFLSGYFMLRHLIADLGNLIFKDFLKEVSKEVFPPLYPTHLEKRLEVIEQNFEGSLRRLNEYLYNFTSSWIQSLVIDDIGIPHIEVLVGCKINNSKHRAATRLEDLIRRYKNKSIHEELENFKQIKVTDAVLTGILDIVIDYQKRFPEIIREKIEPSQERDKNVKLASEEYRKLSEAVHNPIIVDFPPYGSIIEYLGFIHHLRVVRSIFGEITKVYRKQKRQSKNSLHINRGL